MGELYEDLEYMDPGHAYNSLDLIGDTKPPKPSFNAPPIPVEQTKVKTNPDETQTFSPAVRSPIVTTAPSIYEGEKIYLARAPSEFSVSKSCFVLLVGCLVVSCIALGVMSALYGIETGKPCNKDEAPPRSIADEPTTKKPNFVESLGKAYVDLFNDLGSNTLNDFKNAPLE